MPNAAVFPLPVSATPIRSLPWSPIGIDCRWVGLGSLYLSTFSIASIRIGWIGGTTTEEDSRKVQSGGGAFPTFTVMSQFSRTSPISCCHISQRLGDNIPHSFTPSSLSFKNMFKCPCLLSNTHSSVEDRKGSKTH
jgi:hypothetical protein